MAETTDRVAAGLQDQPPGGRGGVDPSPREEARERVLGRASGAGPVAVPGGIPGAIPGSVPGGVPGGVPGRVIAERRPARPKRRGVLPTRSVRVAAFGIISLSIFACGAVCLLAVWGATAEGVPWRALASLGIVAGTMGAFAFVNELFGEAEKNDATVIKGSAG
ncbi:MAG: hypothetical protein AAFX76_07010 [Planctomycetota bacterium]